MLKKIKKTIVWIIFGLVAMWGILFSMFSATTVQAQNRYDEILNWSTDSISGHLEILPQTSGEWGAKTIRNFIIDKVIKIVIPIFIVVGIFLAILGLYRLLFSENPESTKTGIQYLVYGVLWIIIMMSARYLTDALTNKILFEWWSNFDVVPWVMAEQLYEKIAYPFLKLLFYIVLGGMFISLLMTVLKYLFSTEDKMKKTAGTIITRDIIALFTIIGSKQIIEAIYGKQEEILNSNADTLWEIGTAVLKTKEIPILYTVINWIMGLTALIVLILVIYQSYLLLTQPDSADQFTRLKKSIAYIFIGILVIGAGYLIINFLIVN